MKRVLAAMALLSCLAPSTGYAQGVGKPIEEELWCGEVLTVASRYLPPDLTPDQEAEVKTGFDSGSFMLADAGAHYLAGGTAQADLDKLKSDLVVAVTPIVQGFQNNAPYSIDDCTTAIGALQGFSPQPAPGTTTLEQACALFPKRC